MPKIDEILGKKGINFVLNEPSEKLKKSAIISGRSQLVLKRF